MSDVSDVARVDLLDVMFVNRSSAYKADDPAVDIYSEADGSAVDMLRCIRMGIQSTICI